jgi:hypothetical protein
MNDGYGLRDFHAALCHRGALHLGVLELMKLVVPCRVALSFTQATSKASSLAPY